MTHTARLVPLFTALGALALAALSTPARADDTGGDPPKQSEEPAAEPAKEEAKDEHPIVKEVLAEGDGALCGTGRAAVVHYTGTLTDGTQFDSSRDRKSPFAFAVGTGSVIEGWDEAVAQMRVGDRWKVTIPWQKAYGEQGRPPVIPAKADLVFDIELLDVLDVEPTVVTAGSGAALEKGQRIEARVRLAVADGESLKDSWKEEITDQLVVGQPIGITGFDMLVPRLHVGDRVTCRLPPVLAFGDAGRPPRVPPKSEFDVEIEVLRVIEPIVEVLKEGDGATPEAGQTVVVHYTGTLTDGTKFDSSRDRDTPFRFPLGRGRVIEGWDLVVAKMRVGERVKVTIPWPMAYGARGMPPTIPARADLVFDIELLGVE